MSKFFLTGATGFVGSFVAEKLIASGHQVYALARKSSDLKWIRHLPLELVEGSLFSPESYSRILGDVEYVLHVAGVTKTPRVSEYYRGNVEATRLLLNEISRVNPKIGKFLQVSSQAAIGPSPSEKPLREDAPYAPVTDYGKSKAQCEKAVFEFAGKFPVTIVRPPTVYGPRDADVFHAFKSIYRGVNLQVGRVDQLVSVVYVEDLAGGIIDAAISPKTAGKVYHLCEREAVHWSEFARIAGEAMGKNFVNIRIPYRLAWFISVLLEQLARLRNKSTILNRQKMNEIKQSFWTLDNTLAQTDFNYQTNFPLRLGVEKTIQWYLENNWL